MTDTNRYGPTAARKQGKPGRESRPKSTTIDIHSHVAVPAAAAIAGPHVDLDAGAARAFRDRQRQGAQRQAGGRPPLADHRQRQRPRRAPARHGRHGPRHAARHAAAAAMLFHRAGRDRREGDARAQRRHRRLCGAQAGPLRRARHRAAAGRQRGREGARALDEGARLQGLPDPHQRGRQGTVRSGLRAVLGQGRGARRAGGDPSERLHAGRALLAALFLQRDRQSARYDGRAALPDLRRRAGAPPEPEDPRRARRRLSRRLLRPHRSCLGRAHRRRQQAAQAADRVPEEDLLRHRGVHRRTSSNIS